MPTKTALKTAETGRAPRGSHPGHQSAPKPRLHLVPTDWYVKPTSHPAYAWLCRAVNGKDATECRGMDSEEAQDGRLRLRDKDGRNVRVWKVEADLLDRLLAAQASDGAITFRTYRPTNADDGEPEGALKRITYKRRFERN